jgi:hypothetical protein
LGSLFRISRFWLRVRMAPPTQPASSKFCADGEGVAMELIDFPPTASA